MKKITKLNKDELVKVVDSLFTKSKLDWDFYLMLILSAVIVSLGLLLNNVAIVIGGMLVTPLLSPLLVVALGIVVANPKVIWRSSKVLLKSIGVVLLISIVITLLTPNAQIQSELISRSFVNISFFYVALAAGVAAAFAWVKPNLSEVLPGVAISVAILPPLVTIGIGVALWSKTLTLGGLQLFIGNLLGIVIAAALVFAIMGFYRVKKQAGQKVKEEEKEEIKKEIEKVKEEEKIIEEVEKEVEKEEQQKINKTNNNV